jgi:hypothetical protein
LLRSRVWIVSTPGTNVPSVKGPVLLRTLSRYFLQRHMSWSNGVERAIRQTYHLFLDLSGPGMEVTIAEVSMTVLCWIGKKLHQ